MKVADLSIKRPVTVVMVFLIILGFSAISFLNLEIDLLPEMELPMAIVVTTYANVAPEEVETMLTVPLEKQLGSISGLDTMSSASSLGSSMIMLNFVYGTNMDAAMQDIREKLDLISGYLPSDSEKPMVMKLDPDFMPVVSLGFYGAMDLEEINQVVDDLIIPEFERLPGVASADISGEKVKEIKVEVDPFLLESYGLSISDLQQNIAYENRDASLGTVDEGSKKLVIRGEGKFTEVEQIGEILIPLRTGESVRLKDIAVIEDTFKQMTSYSYLNGEPCIMVNVMKQSGANTVEISRRLWKTLDNIQDRLPTEMKYAKAFDTADYIQSSISGVAYSAVIGAVLAIIIIFLFLRSVKSTFIIGTAIPISIFSIFTFMYFADLTINIITLGGLVLGVGMIVDNSIIVLENIYRYRNLGFSMKESASKGTAEIAGAVVASTLTTVVVYLPLIYVKGISGQMLKPLSWTVILSLSASLLVSLTLVPMLCSKLLDDKELSSNEKKKSKGLYRISRKFSDLIDRLENRYATLLGWALTRKKRIVLITLIAFILSMAAIPLVGMEFMPEGDDGEFQVTVTLPQGTNLETTAEVLFDIEKTIKQIPELKDYMLLIGGSYMSAFGESPSNTGSLSIRLVSVTERKRGTGEIIEEVRNKIALVPGVDVTIDSMSRMNIGKDVSIGVKGRDLDVLKMLSEDIEEIINSVPGTRQVESDFSNGNPQVSLTVDREVAALYGVNTSSVFHSISQSLGGNMASRFSHEGHEIDIRIFLPEINRDALDDVGRIMVPTISGGYVPVEEIAELEYNIGPAAINREGQVRRINIEADVFGRDPGRVNKDIMVLLKNYEMPDGYYYTTGGANEAMVEAFTDLALALVLAIFLVYMVMASQFEALLDPFIIMFSVPPTFIGVILGFLITRSTLSVTSFMGMIMLVGIVVNNAIVLIDYIKTLREEGMPRDEAVIESGRTRLRPILMTTLTTVLALIPQALGIFEGSEMMAPMALTIAFGLSFSTLITLILVPVIYSSFDVVKERRRNKKAAAAAEQI